MSSASASPPPDDDRGTVRDAAFAVLRTLGLTRIFSNPGSTEIDLLLGLPDDFSFVLGLHESAVVGMATGWALGRGAPALAIVHTTAGLGNAVSALATARVNRAPLVVIVGQQDRRHVAYEPFLTGRLDGLAGDYPVWVNQPPTAQDVPAALLRAHHEAQAARGPAIVVVAMNDWGAPARPDDELAAPRRVLHAARADPGAVSEVAQLLNLADAPAVIAGAGVDSGAGWAALVDIAERMQAPVWQEPFTGQAGFPQDHALFAGHLPIGRAALRTVLRDHDALLVAGTAALRQYLYEPGPLFAPGTRVAVITADPGEAHRSAAEVALVAPVADACAQLSGALTRREPATPRAPWRPAAPAPTDGPLRAGHVLHELAQRLTPETILIEESPSSRPELIDRIVARRPLGFLSPAMGGLGFAIPAAIGLRMADPARPVVAVVGDGSSLYSIQALWSAARYGVGAVFVVMANGGYAVMDELADAHGGGQPWPGFAEVDIAAISRGLGCEAISIDGHGELVSALDDVVVTLTTRERPLLLAVTVSRSP